MQTILQDKPTIQTALFHHWLNDLWQRSFGENFADNGTNRKYLLADALGSTRNLIDSTGATVKSYNYDVFGSIRTQSGSGSTSFKFTGEQTDDESGLIFLRARYYDPEIGRFISKDPFRGYETDAQSLNPYPYVKNNPTNLVDPEGLWYANVNFSVGIFWTGITFGIQVSDKGIYVYGGAGAVTSAEAGLSLTYSPDNPSEGISTNVSGQLGIAAAINQDESGKISREGGIGIGAGGGIYLIKTKRLNFEGYLEKIIPSRSFEIKRKEKY